MNEILQQIGLFILSYVAVLGIGYFLLNFLTHGFITTFIRVKASRGRRQMLIIHETTTTRYKIGRIEEGFLLWKGEDNKLRRCSVERQCVHRVMGLDAFELDNEGRFVLPNQNVIQGYDHSKTENLLTRCLTAPKTESLNFRILIILAVIILLGIIVVGYMSYRNYDLIRGLGTIVSQTI